MSRVSSPTSFLSRAFSSCKSFSWRKGDIIALPPWSLHEHINSSAKADAVLFSIQDVPVLTALGLYYEEEYTDNGGHQKVTAAFGA